MNERIVAADSSKGFEINEKLSFHITAEFVRQLSKLNSK